MRSFSRDMPTLAADERGDAGADLERGVFGAERVAATDGEGGEEELADDGLEGDVAVVDVERGLGLVDAAAAYLREDEAGCDGDDEADEGGDVQEAGLARGGRGAEKEDLQPLDGHAERDDEQAGDDADEDGEQEEEALFAGGRERFGDSVGEGRSRSLIRCRMPMPAALRSRGPLCRRVH